MKKLVLPLMFGLASALPVHAQSSPEIFLSITTGTAQTQGMALALANQALTQMAGVRVLLCSDGGLLAVKSKESAPLKPANKSPKEMLQGLMKAGAKVEICFQFLPNNSEWKETDLLDGITVAKPAEVAAYILRPNVKTMSY